MEMLSDFEMMTYTFNPIRELGSRPMITLMQTVRRPLKMVAAVQENRSASSHSVRDDLKKLTNFNNC
jgi:hypothetical protein